MTTREKLARLLFSDYTNGTGYLWEGELLQEEEYRLRAYQKADAILAVIAPELRGAYLLGYSHGEKNIDEAEAYAEETWPDKEA